MAPRPRSLATRAGTFITGAIEVATPDDWPSASLVAAACFFHFSIDMDTMIPDAFRSPGAELLDNIVNSCVWPSGQRLADDGRHVHVVSG